MTRSVATPLFSPNSDGRNDRARVPFTIKKDGRRLRRGRLDADGDQVRDLADGRALKAYRAPALAWDGRDDDGREVKDGTYRYRITLRRAGAQRQLPDAGREGHDAAEAARDLDRPGRLDGPESRDVAQPPRRRPMRVRLFVPGRNAGVLVYPRRTRRPAQLVLERGVPLGRRRPGAGRHGRGRARLPSGTYLVAARSRDKAGNIGTSPSPLPPAPAYGTAPRGQGGGADHVASRRRRPPRRSGDGRCRVPRRLRRGGARRRRCAASANATRARTGPARARAWSSRRRAASPACTSSTCARRTRTSRSPSPCSPPRSARSSSSCRSTTWQGRNSVDDDGDGLPNLLDRGLPVRLARVLAGDGLPADVRRARRPAARRGWTAQRPALRHHDRRRARAAGRARSSAATTGVAARRRHPLAAARGCSGAARARARRRHASLPTGTGTCAARSQSRRAGASSTRPRRRRRDLFGARLRPRARPPPGDPDRARSTASTCSRGTDGQLRALRASSRTERRRRRPSCVLGGHRHAGRAPTSSSRRASARASSCGSACPSFAGSAPTRSSYAPERTRPHASAR